jgi:hypothetical protein
LFSNDIFSPKNIQRRWEFISFEWGNLSGALAKPAICIYVLWLFATSPRESPL